MMTAEISEKDKQVLEFVKSELRRYEHQNGVLIFFGVGAKDMVKFIERPEACGKWPFDFVCEMMEAIKKMHAKFIIPYPEIEEQTEEDRVLAKLLKKHDHIPKGMDAAYIITQDDLKDIVAYMERREVIKEWTAYYLSAIQYRTKLIKDFFLKE